MSSGEYVEVGSGIRLHVRDWGQGKPIVFIHGWPLSNEMYEYQFADLAKRGFRCVGISLRGFGKSDQPWGPYNYDVFADDIRMVLDAKNLQDATLAGFSMGGAIAIRYMARHQGHRITSLALFGAAAPLWTRRPDFAEAGLDKAAADDLLRQCLTDRPQLLENFGRIFFRTEHPPSKAMGAWFFGLNLQASPHATAACIEALRDTDLREDLAVITVPTAIFHGVHDKICPFPLAEAMAKGIKGASIIRFENSGHGLFVEEKDKFNDELATFARGVPDLADADAAEIATVS
jgi:non-heme chloroperoxidase